MNEGQFAPGQSVRLLRPEYGTAQGPSVEHGAGQMREVASGSLCEIFGADRTTGWLTVHYDLDDSGPNEPYRVEIIVEPEHVEPVPRPARQGWEGEMPDPPPEPADDGRRH